MHVFISLALFVDSIYMILLDNSFVKFNDDVRRGNLDLLLTKPISSMFTLGSQRMSATHFSCFFITGRWFNLGLSSVSHFCLKNYSSASRPSNNWSKLGCILARGS